jgi:hypothetical protein
MEAAARIIAVACAIAQGVAATAWAREGGPATNPAATIGREHQPDHHQAEPHLIDDQAQQQVQNPEDQGQSRMSDSNSPVSGIAWIETPRSTSSRAFSRTAPRISGTTIKADSARACEKPQRASTPAAA